MRISIKPVDDMKILDNITNTVRDDLRVEIKKGSRVSIAAACFSMYAYKELKKQLETIDEFKFIFTKRLKSRSGSSTFPAFLVKRAFTVQSLKSNCAMR